MNKDINKNERQSLNKLEMLSKEISDLIYSGDFANIENLNFKRLQIIKIFKNTSNNHIKNKLLNISEINKKHIQEIEDKKKTMTLNHSKFINRFKAYS
jgi:hypothetical protein|tara:strand:- start:204 stop:497 length:294 start_codon:yes stop_codon:yes gene_type:complete